MSACYVILLCVLLLLLSTSTVLCSNEEGDKWGSARVFTETTDDLPEWDPNGYVFFCLCMGRTGNQLEHLLGGMAFAELLNRTLVLPPFRTYRNVRFTEWFQLAPLAAWHRVVLAEDFMRHLAPTHWPPEKRTGFCFGTTSMAQDKPCEMKIGNPFGPFWDGLGVDFALTEYITISHRAPAELWNSMYPASRFPVLALRGAPAPFPVLAENRALQRHLVPSEFVESEAQQYIDRFFPDTPFIGIHLRNGPDWANACQSVAGLPSYMASPQCLENTGRSLTISMCFPTDQEVLRLLREVVEETGLQVVFVATDRRPMLQEIEQHLADKKVRAYHADPHLPLVDITILSKAQHFIGNCVSSFTSYVTRARQLEGKPTSFWGFS